MTPPSLSPHELRSLALIRRLLQKAEDEAEAPAPLSALALTTAHTAVEWFLGLAAEHHGVEPQSFKDHWSKFDQQADIQLTQKQGMSRLDDLRGTLKHHGGIHSQQDIDSLLARTREFLEDNTPKVFGVKLSDVSLIKLVPDSDARQALEEALNSIEEGDLKSALEHVTKAIDHTLRAAPSQEIGVPRLQRFRKSEIDSVVDETGSQGFRQFAAKLRGEIDSIYKILELITIGVDLQRYTWFERVTPTAHRSLAGEYEFVWRTNQASKLTEEQARAALDFVVETALAADEVIPAEFK